MTKNTLKIVTPIIISILLSGCAANGIPTPLASLPEAIEEGNEKSFVGIPVLLSAEGTTVRLDDEWLLTASHNRLIYSLTYDEYHIHPTCDVALLRSKGAKPEYDLGIVRKNGKITHVGYPMFMPLSASKGVYFQDVIAENVPRCQMSMTTGVLAAGMSGGGVFNDKNQLVGVNHGVFMFRDFDFEGKTYESPAVFTSLFAIKDWIEEITGKKITLEGS